MIHNSISGPTSVLVSVTCIAFVLLPFAPFAVVTPFPSRLPRPRLLSPAPCILSRALTANSLVDVTNSCSQRRGGTPPFEVCRSKTIDLWLALVDYGSMALASLLHLRPLRPFSHASLAPIFFLLHPRLLYPPFTATSLGGVTKAPLSAVGGAAELVP